MPQLDQQRLEAEWERAQADVQRLRQTIARAYLGGSEVVEQLTAGLLAGGHVLIEGVPGLGKTTLARSLASALSLHFQRIQFTPDLMPADVLGVRMLVEDENGVRRFEFQPGPIFCQILLADEINRASPRTQSALLEAMQEGQVTMHGTRYALAEPFLVVATQNPIEMEGTYPLPEAQLDRFMLRVQMHSPTQAELEAVLRATLVGPKALDRELEPVLDAKGVLRLRELASQITVASPVLSWIARTICATRPDDRLAPESIRRCVRLGASPRGAQSLLWAARARALLHGRMHVADEDVMHCAAPALGHRLCLTYEGLASGPKPDQLVQDALQAARAERTG